MNAPLETPASRALSRLVWLPWIGVLLLVCALTIVTLRVNGNLRDRRICREHLEEIYQALVRSNQENGSLPRLDFYPTNTRNDQDSLLVALRDYGIREADCQCPRSPASIREGQGLTYLWNVELNGIPLKDVQDHTWMLIEISALSATAKAPHFGRYNILLANGTVVERSEVPAGILVPSKTP